MKAIEDLKQLGYLIELKGEDISLIYQGQGKPDSATVKPLLRTLEEHKKEAVAYLQKKKDPFLGHFQKALADLNQHCQPGTMDWIEQESPDLFRKIEEAEVQLDELWREADLKQFQEGLRKWQELHEQVMQAYSQPEFSDLAVLLESGQARDLPPLKISQAETVTEAETFLRSYLRDLGHPTLRHLAYKQLEAFRKTLKEEEN